MTSSQKKKVSKPTKDQAKDPGQEAPELQQTGSRKGAQSRCPPASLLAMGAARGKAPDMSPDINSSSLWLGFGEAVLCQRTVHGEGSEAGAGCSCLEHVGWHMPGWCNRRGCIALQIPQGDERLRPWLGHCCPDKATYDSCETTVAVRGAVRSFCVKVCPQTTSRGALAALWHPPPTCAAAWRVETRRSCCCVSQDKSLGKTLFFNTFP